MHSTPNKTAFLFGLGLLSTNLAASPNPESLLNKLPLTFEENRGQADMRAQFTAHLSDGRVFVTRDGATFALGFGAQRSAVKLSFPGSNAKATTLTGEQDTGAVSNFFKGSDSAKWTTNARQFRSVRAHNIKPGIDILYYGTGQNLEYDLLLHPGADATNLRFRFDGADKLSLNAEGNLIVQTAAGIMEQHRPAVYQQNVSSRTKIEASYRLESPFTAVLTLAPYNLTRELVVDPILSFSTYLGGKNDDSANAVAIDSSGNIYVTGFTASTDFPTSIGAYRVALNATSNDVFVTKLNPTGTAVIYSTLIGGSLADVANAIGLDSAGNVIVAGSTQSNDFPTTAGSLAVTSGGRGLFVTKLNSSGTALVYSTYFGAANSYQDTLTGLAVDSASNVYLVGTTGSLTFPTTAGAYSTVLNKGSSNYNQDAFVTKLNSTGSALVYSTFLGGSFYETAAAVTLDSSNQAYVIGSTSSTDFPVSTTAFQKTIGLGQNSYNSGGFVTCVNAYGSGLTYSTYLNGSNGATLSAIALDPQQNAYVVGQARSADFPVTSGAFSTTFSGSSEAFVAKLNYNGSNLLYSTFLGGSADDAAHTVAVDSSGAAIVTGTTSSPNFPVTPGSFPPVQQPGYYNAVQNFAFLTKLNSTASSVLYSTPFGSGVTTVDRALVLDSVGNAIIAGNSLSKTLPTTAGASQRTNPDVSGLTYGTAFVAKVDLNSTTMCSLSLSVTSIATPLAGTTGTINVTVNPGCPWEASSLDSVGNATYVVLSSVSGVGNGSFTYTVPSNYTNVTPRTAAIKVGNAVATVTQPAGSCLTPGLSPSYQNLDFNGGLNSVSVQLPGGCYYNPIASAPWIQLSSTTTANGSTSVYYFIPRNDYAARSGYINIAGTQFPILQTGASCTAALGVSTTSFGSQGGTGVIPFTVSPASCQWTALSYVPWIKLTNSSGTSSGTDSFTVAPNPGSASRTGQVLIAGQLFTLTQGGGSTVVPNSYTVNSIVGTGNTFYYATNFGGDGGSALSALISNPQSLTYDSAGNLYIADTGNYRIRKVDVSGNISTFAGNGSSVDSGDGGPATSASFNGLSNLTFDTANNLYFLTSYRVKVISSTGTISTAAGTGSPGAATDGSLATSSIPPISGLIVDSAGSIYLSEASAYRISRLTSGTLNFYAGTGVSGFNGDGLAPMATQLAYPGTFARDANGTLHFVDGGRIRKIVNGVVTTIAGGGSGDADGVSATSISLNTSAMAFDNQGSIFYTDSGRVRRISNGIVMTIAGTSSSYSYSGDGGPAQTANFYNPAGVAVDKYGNIAIADSSNNRVRLLTPVYSACTYSLSANNVTVSAAGGTAPITVTTTAACSYNASPNVPWILVTASSTGTGTANLTYSANNTTSSRTGTVYLAGQLVTITQSAGTGTPAPVQTKGRRHATPILRLGARFERQRNLRFRRPLFSLSSRSRAISPSPATGPATAILKSVSTAAASSLSIPTTTASGMGLNGGDSFIALGGQTGDVPVVGDWNGDGRTKVGIYRNGFWILDTNGNGVFDAGDQYLAYGGNRRRTTRRRRLERRRENEDRFSFITAPGSLDYNGSGVFDTGDKVYSFPYAAGDKAIVGDWNGTHTAKIGIYRAGFWDSGLQRQRFLRRAFRWRQVLCLRWQSLAKFPS